MAGRSSSTVASRRVEGVGAQEVQRNANSVKFLAGRAGVAREGEVAPKGHLPVGIACTRS